MTGQYSQDMFRQAVGNIKGGNYHHCILWVLLGVREFSRFEYSYAVNMMLHKTRGVEDKVHAYH